MAKQRNRSWQDAYVQRAFETARDCPPVVMDALRRLCIKIRELIEEKNQRTVAAARQVRKRAAGGGGKVALGAGAVVTGTKEALDFLFVTGLEKPYPHLLDFIQLGGVDAAILGMLTAAVTWVVRRQ